MFAAAERALAERPAVALALATLHAVDGSSYRQPGARLLVDAEGRVLAGAVSGGCLEGDVAAHAAAVCAAGIPKRLTYDLRDDLQTIWGFGAMCDGVAHLLLEPLRDLSWMTAAVAARRTRTPGALVTLLEETPDGGTRMLESCAPAWQQTLQEPLAAARHTELPVSASTTPSTTASPMGSTADSAGELRFLIDPLVPPVSLVLIGAGRGAEAFASIANTLGWHVTLIDHRPFVLSSLPLPEGVQRVVARAEDGVAHVSRDARTAVALLTHQFAIDAEWLARLLPLPVGYIGVLGSRTRAAQLVDTLREGGLVMTPRMRGLLHAPIGLDLGGESPESIALAAIAEIEAVVHGRPGGALRERQSPIHARTPTPHVPS